MADQGDKGHRKPTVTQVISPVGLISCPERQTRGKRALVLEHAGSFAGGNDVLQGEIFYGLISTIVPFGASLAISSISSSDTAIHPFVQSISA